MSRWLIVVLAVFALIATGCGGDDGTDAGGEDPAGIVETGAGQDDGPAGETPAGEEPPPAAEGGGAGGGEVLIEGQTVTLQSLSCFFRPQESAGSGGGTLELTAQGNGQSADGQPVLFDFTRYGDDTNEPRDHVVVQFGDLADPSETIRTNLDLGAVEVGDRSMSVDAGEVSFDLTCSEVVS